MFCVASRTDPNQLAALTLLDNKTLLKQSISSWSSETKGFAQRILSVIEKEYIPTFQKQIQLPILQETHAVLSGKLYIYIYAQCISHQLGVIGSQHSPSHFFPHVFVELITYIGQYLAFQSELGCESLHLVHSQLVGVSGLSIAGIMAAYSFGTSDSLEQLETNAVTSALTLLEISCFIEGNGISKSEPNTNFEIWSE